MLRFIAFILLLLVIAVVYPGCRARKEVTNKDVGSIDTTNSFSADTVKIPSKKTEVAIDFNAICDSLSKNKSSNVEVKSGGTTVIVNVPTSGIGTVSCNEDSLVLIIDSLRHKQVIKIDSSHFTQVEIFKCDKKFHTFSIGWFWATVAVLLVFIAAKLSFKKL